MSPADIGQTVILFGATYSVYTRIARIVLEEKGIGYELREIDIFDAASIDPGYAAIHPFRKIPALDHGGFVLYETAAIARYVDEAFAGIRLQPADPQARARMNQIVSIVDSYLYPTLIWQLVVERLFAAEEGRAADETVAAAGVDAGRRGLGAIVALVDAPFLAGENFTLADAWLAPVVAYARLTDEGAAMLRDRPMLARWWDVVSARPSLLATRYPMEIARNR